MKRGTTAAPSTYHPPNSVQPDDGTTLWGLECLPADLCRALGCVSTRPSAVSDLLLRWPSSQDAGVWQPGQDGLCRVPLPAVWPGHPTGGGSVLKPTFKGPECPCRFFALRALHTTR